MSELIQSLEKDLEEIKEKEQRADEILNTVLELPKREKNIILRAMANKKLPGDSTHYSEKYALQIFPDFKEMMDNQIVLQYSYADYPLWSKNTIHQT